MATLYKYEAGGRTVTYLDAEDTYSAEDIRKHWAGTFPELGNANSSTDETKQTVTHEGAEVEVDKVVTFAKRAGTKGGDEVWSLYKVAGFIDIGKGWHEWYDERVRAENALQAGEIVLERVGKIYEARVTWGLDGPVIVLIPEDRAMQELGMAMLLGLSEVWDG